MRDMKFPKKDGLPDGIWTRMKIGLELLYLLKASANAVDRKNSHNPKGLMKHFDLLDGINAIEVSRYKFIIGLKKVIYGKEFLDECIVTAVEIYKKCDIDLMREVGLASTKMLEDKNPRGKKT